MELETEQHAISQDDVSARGDQSSIQSHLAVGAELNIRAVDPADGGAL